MVSEQVDRVNWTSCEESRMSYWAKLTDEELKKRLWDERKRAQYAQKKQERAIAHANIEAIIREQARRFERSFGLE